MLADALEHLVRGIVKHPDDVTVRDKQLRRGSILEVRVHPEDLGKVIGRNGRTATALRTVVGALRRQGRRPHRLRGRRPPPLSRTVSHDRVPPSWVAPAPRSWEALVDTERSRGTTRSWWAGSASRRAPAARSPSTSHRRPDRRFVDGTSSWPSARGTGPGGPASQSSAALAPETAAGAVRPRSTDRNAAEAARGSLLLATTRPRRPPRTPTSSTTTSWSVSAVHRPPTAGRSARSRRPPRRAGPPRRQRDDGPYPRPVPFVPPWSPRST